MLPLDPHLPSSPTSLPPLTSVHREISTLPYTLHHLSIIEQHKTPTTATLRNLEHHVIDKKSTKAGLKAKMESQEWHLTVLLLEGLLLMRPEKAWRPIISVEVDAHGDGTGTNAGGIYETTLGIDGQCVNQREGMRIPEASPSSRVEIKVWHRAQSKKKKRRVLVASASCCLGELQKRQEGSSEGKLDIRLQCRTADQKTSAARGRPQKGASLKLKLRPLPSLPSTSSRSTQAYSTATIITSDHLPSRETSRSTTLDSNHTEDSQFGVDYDENKPLLAEDIGSPVGSTGAKWPSDKSSEDNIPDLITFDDPPSLPLPPEQTLRRRRRVKGYAIDTDDECKSASASESEAESLLSPSQALYDDDTYSATFVDDECEVDDVSMTPHPSHLTLSLSHHKHTTTTASSEDLVFRPASGEIDVVSFSSTTTERGIKVWIATARDMLLPQYTEKIVVPRNRSKAEKVLATFTLYAELSSAETEEDFEPIIRRLQSEWAVVGGLLLAMTGVTTAMFTISPGGMFTVGRHAQAAIATSSVSSGLGIACTTWFFLRYHWADTPTFISRSRDVFDSHFFFSLSARVPALCMFCSACSLTVCLALIAFATFPQGVLILCFMVGVLMSLQFIVFGINWAAKRVVQSGKKGGEKVRVVVRSMTGRGEA